jgi:hypothetical protein
MNPAPVSPLPGIDVRPIQILSLLGLLAVGAPEAQAQDFGSLFRYNYLEVDYVRTEVDQIGPGLHGYGAKVSIESTDGVRVLGNWRDAKGEGNTRQDLEAGVGFHNGVSRQIDAILDFKYLHSQRKMNVETKKEHGFGIEGGIRSFVHDLVELDFSVEYRSLFKSEFGGRAGLLFHGTENIALTVNYTYFQEQEILEAGIRISL